MIITLSGVSGCGKSHYKNYLIDKMNFENMIIYTTRKCRNTEKSGIDKFFVTKNKFEELKNNGVFFATYTFLQEYYGYSKQHISPNTHCVTEVNYEWIDDFKKKAKEDILSIYIFPEKKEFAKQAIRDRQLDKNVEENCIREVDNHYRIIENEEVWLKKFNYVIYNDYTSKTDKKIDEILKKEGIL